MSELSAKIDRFVFAQMRDDLQTLERQPEFQRFMGRLVQRCGLTDAYRGSNGSEMFQIEGRRQVAVETLQEVEKYAAESGFFERVLAARRAYEQTIKGIELTHEEKEKQQEEDDAG